jgi:hypothetical protein
MIDQAHHEDRRASATAPNNASGDDRRQARISTTDIVDPAKP